MKVLITGVSGHLGSELFNRLIKNNDIYGTYLTNKPFTSNQNIFRIDLRNKQDVISLIKKIKPDYIVHCAALTNVELCEKNKEEAWASNVIATKNILDAKALNSKIIFISTDYVFDGNKGIYNEQDTANPINFYGKTKLMGEWLTANAPDSIVVRTSSLLGHWLGGYVDAILSGLEKGDIVKGAKDMISSPTLASELAEAISNILNFDFSMFAIYHMAGDTRISRYELAKKLADAFGYDSERIEPTTAKEIGFKAPRPKDTSLDISKSKSNGITFSKIDNAIIKLKDSYEKK